MSKMTMPMAVFGGLALIAVSLSLPTILHTAVISEARAATNYTAAIKNASSRIAREIKHISACRN